MGLDKLSVNDIPSATTPRLTLLSDLLDTWKVDAGEAHDAFKNGKPRGPAIEFGSLKNALGPAWTPGLHFIHAQPAAGKTCFTRQAATSTNTPSLFVSCEMSPLEIFRRHTAHTTSTFLGRLKNGELTAEESFRLAVKAAKASPAFAILDGTQQPARPADLRSAAITVRGTSPFILIVIDSLHSWAESCFDDSQEYEVLNTALSTLRRLSSELACPILVVAERNRQSSRKGGMNAGAGTRKIEYGAETLMELNRDDSEDDSNEVLVNLKIVKNRNGAPRELKLRFNLALQRFTERNHDFQAF